MNRHEKAMMLLNSGYNCAQSVFSVYSDLFGIGEKDAKSIATGFGAGFGRLQKTCGAVSGAIMLIGCKYHDENDVLGSKELTYRKTREFIEEFEKRNNTVKCLDLMEVDFNSENGLEIAREKSLFKLKCEKYVKDVCEILEKFL